ncbi:MAG TPA: TerC family protein, partial [Verrucomicrobiae bacterium]|nr:TerC family protein [Verrucomicrobiae bacterium]
GMMKIFRYLHYGLGAILIFVGIKMIVTDIYHIPIVVALAVIAVILAASIIVSIMRPVKEEP